MADPERFDMDLDPTFHADGDPNPKLKLGRKKKIFKISSHLMILYSFQNRTKRVCVIFSVTMQEEEG